nr:hypothetical protein [Tanacetum cinerariifolium]
TNAAGLCGGSDGGVMGIVGSGGELQEIGEMELWRVAGKKVVYSTCLNVGEEDRRWSLCIHLSNVGRKAPGVAV